LYLLAGLLAYHRKPDNRVGVLMIAVGAAFFSEDLQFAKTPWVHTIGEITFTAHSGFLVHLVLAYPTGRLGSRNQRLLVGFSYAVAFLSGLVEALFMDSHRHFKEKAPGLLLITDFPDLVKAWGIASEVFTVVVSVALLVTLLRRWRKAQALLRSLLAPVIAVILTGSLISAVGTSLNYDPRLHDSLLIAYDVAFLALPAGVLAGIWRLYLGRSAVGQLLMQLQAETVTRGRLQRLLIATLHDPSIQIAARDSSGLIDVEGAAIVIGPRSLTPLPSGSGSAAACLIHDPLLHENEHVLEAVATAAGLALVNHDLTVQLAQQLAEVRASRVRIIDAAEAERRRIERDLHDGAQQRLVTALAGIRLAQRKVAETDRDVFALLERTADNLSAAHAEIRELARGLHPAALTEAGLVAAVDALVGRLPLPVRLTASNLPRLNPRIESAAYFATAEALTNVLRHARAKEATVDLVLEENRLIVRISDNGIGGADPARGSGLTGLDDRLAAVAAELRLWSPHGGGTILEAVFPLDDQE
jgi:signal transduction histidine kinase